MRPALPEPPGVAHRRRPPLRRRRLRRSSRASSRSAAARRADGQVARRYLRTASGAQIATMPDDPGDRLDDVARASARRASAPGAALHTAVTGWWLANAWSQSGIVPGRHERGRREHERRDDRERRRLRGLARRGRVRPTIANSHDERVGERQHEQQRGQEAEEVRWRSASRRGTRRPPSAARRRGCGAGRRRCGRRAPPSGPSATTGSGR